ncbi:MAG: M23 family metallopeptidase [Ruminococcus sp.]|nr:M23 family metallopeptidase [Ruminococcus sp.]
MKQEANEAKKGRLKGFYTALLISLAMIGAACAYAYQATTVTLEENLESLQEDFSSQAETLPTDFTAQNYNSYTEPAQESYNAVVGVKTDLPMETETNPAETSTESAETEPAAQETEAAPEGEFAHVLVSPMEGEVMQPFSNGELVKSETTGTWQTHNGADIAGEEGAAVCAIDNGTVAEVTKDPLWGICVSIDHGNGVVSRYCGLSASLSVQNGDTVESGQTIGTVGNTADMESKQESHLHFEVQKNGVYVDPIAYVSE